MMRQPTPSDQETRTDQAGDLDTVLRHYVTDPTASWGLGTYGAVAEFHRTSDEPASIDTEATLQAVTARGALRIGSTQELHACAYEQPGHASESWSHVLTLCLPAASSAMHRRTVLTECGPDHEALRPQDRAAVLFDLGLGTAQVDVCVRTADPETLAHLRAGLGRSLFAPDNPLMQVMPRLSPHRVFICRFARPRSISAFRVMARHRPKDPILMCSQTSSVISAPTLRPRPFRTDGYRACLYPANPIYDALGHPRPFDHAAYKAFQTLLRGFGDPALVRLKETVTEAVLADQAPNGFALPASRAERAAVRVALRQLAHTDGHRPMLAAWRQAFDRLEPTED